MATIPIVIPTDPTPTPSIESTMDPKIYFRLDSLEKSNRQLLADNDALAKVQTASNVLLNQLATMFLNNPGYVPSEEVVTPTQE